LLLFTNMLLSFLLFIITSCISLIKVSQVADIVGCFNTPRPLLCVLSRQVVGVGLSVFYHNFSDVSYRRYHFAIDFFLFMCFDVNRGTHSRPQRRRCRRVWRIWVFRKSLDVFLFIDCEVRALASPPTKFFNMRRFNERTVIVPMHGVITKIAADCGCSTKQVSLALRGHNNTELTQLIRKRAIEFYGCKY
jgi:hypothetical protein